MNDNICDICGYIPTNLYSYFVLKGPDEIYRYAECRHKAQYSKRVYNVGKELDAELTKE